MSRIARARVLVLSAIVLTAAPAGAQEILIPSSPSAFGAPSLATPHRLDVDPNKPTLPSPADLPADHSAAAPGADLAFGAFQRGFYSTAMQEAMKRVKRNANDGPAMTLIAELYEQGLGVQPSTSEAARWFALAAQAGDAQGMFELGLMRMKGEGMKADRAGAKDMFLRAASLDHPGAQFYLGVMALQNNGVVPDYKTAATYFERSAALGNVEAQYAMAIIYRNGTGRPKDDAKAAALMKQAADNDNTAAEVEYGIMLFNGVGTDKDEAAAARYFIKAAGHNNPVAQDRAARLYVTGRGIKKDVVEGMKWHMLSRAAGLQDAWLDGEMNKLTRDQRSAVELAVRRYVGS